MSNLLDIGFGASPSLGTGNLMDPDYGSVGNIVGNTQMKIPTVNPTYSGNTIQPKQSAWGSFTNFMEDPFGQNVDYRAEFEKLMPGGSETQYNDFLKGKFYEQQLNPGFDWGGALNIGLSAFDVFNKDKGQDRMLDYYDDAMNMQKNQINRSNAVKNSYGSAFSNAS